VNELIFVVQKICLKLCLPVFVSIVLGVVGIMVWHRRTVSRACLTSAVALFLVCSFPITGLLLVRTLESQAGGYANPETLVHAGVRYIVVLSGGFREGGLSTADRLGISVLRLHEGVRLWRQVSGSKLLVTGGVIPGLNTEIPLAKALGDMARELGVPADALCHETASWTTEDQAQLVSAMVGSQPFALVTSAYHVPRSMLIFRRAGLQPIPAPCDFLARKILIHYETLLPSAEGLLLTQLAAQEYLAAWYVKMKQRLSTRWSPEM